jgi:hypothetical protein
MAWQPVSIWNHALYALAVEQKCSRYVFVHLERMIKSQFFLAGASIHGIKKTSG